VHSTSTAQTLISRTQSLSVQVVRRLESARAIRQSAHCRDTMSFIARRDIYRSKSLAFSLKRYDRRHNTRNMSICREQKLETMLVTTNSTVVTTTALYILIYYYTLHVIYNCTSLPVSLNSAAIFLHAKLVKSALE
jgi:hypothetical protein